MVVIPQNTLMALGLVMMSFGLIWALLDHWSIIYAKVFRAKVDASLTINSLQYLLQVLTILIIISIAVFFGIYLWDSSPRLKEPIVVESNSNSHIDETELVVAAQKGPKIKHKDGLTYLMGKIENVDVRYVKDDYHSLFKEEIVVRVRVDLEVFDLVINTNKHYASEFRIGDELKVSGLRNGNTLYDVEVLN